MGLDVEIPARELFIGGEWVAPIKGKYLPVINPSTEEICGKIPAATVEDVDLAVQAAKAAFSRNNGALWARATGKVRAGYLRAIAAKVAERKKELAILESTDCGKPIDESEWDMDDVSACFEYYADLAEKLDERQYAPLELPMEQFKCNLLREPIGVVALITPWSAFYL